MKTLDEILHTPVLILTSDEIERMDPKDQAWARNAQAIDARHRACVKHEPTGTSTRNGWHSLKCKHCGKDMSYDSGD